MEFIEEVYVPEAWLDSSHTRFNIKTGYIDLIWAYNKKTETVFIEKFNLTIPYWGSLIYIYRPKTVAEEYPAEVFCEIVRKIFFLENAENLYFGRISCFFGTQLVCEIEEIKPNGSMILRVFEGKKSGRKFITHDETVMDFEILVV